MKLAIIKKPRARGKQHGYRIEINQILYYEATRNKNGSIRLPDMKDVKICECFVSASVREGKKELAKALKALSDVGIY